MYWNPKEQPMHTVTLSHFEKSVCLNDITSVDLQQPILTITRKIHAKLVDAVDEEILKAIIDGAREEGIDDLILIDKEFIISAIKHEKERRGLC